MTEVTPTTSYRDAAVTLWGDAGAYAHDAYQRWLPLFPELPSELPIVIGITAYGHCVGLTRSAWEHGPRITIASNHFKHGRYAVDDTMVHEMTHAWLYLTGQEGKHDSEAWYAAIRRLSPVGWAMRSMCAADRSVDRCGYKDAGGISRVRKEQVPELEGLQAKVAGWPSTFRPAGHDQGDPIRCPSY